MGMPVLELGFHLRRDVPPHSDGGAAEHWSYLRSLASSASSALTVSAPTISECFAITGFIASRNLASSAADNSVTCMPFFFRLSSAVPAASRETWRWYFAASTAASPRIFFSALPSVSQIFLLKINDCGLYW